jgi:pimeloyl-ACP methyl ester carboxylesterase
MRGNRVDYTPVRKQRFRELLPGANGKFQAEWQLTDTKLTEAVKLTLPPAHAIPIVFVPGIMGSNLCNLKNMPVWLLNSVKNIPIGLAWNWSRKNAGARQSILHPERTKVYNSGAVPEDSSALGLTQRDYLKRGWGEVSEASYHKFLLWLDHKMNGERNPANWEDFSLADSEAPTTLAEKLTRKLPPGVVMRMHGLPNVAEGGYAVDPVKSDELLRRSKSIFPVYAYGYNWLASNKEAAASLKARIERIIAANNAGAITCTQVILVTHSMGGLVARACSQLPGMSSKIVGIVHGVMPATGAAVAYRRCKVGMKDEDAAAGLVIGSDGKEVTAVFAQSPGALQLLPSQDYGTKWLDVNDTSGKLITSLPLSDPYEEIYLQREKWWGLIREEWLHPQEGMPISWKDFVANIQYAKEFHRKLAKKYHRNTYVFYGGGTEKGSFSKIRWNIMKGIAPAKVGASRSAADVLGLSHKDMRTDGSNNLYVGGETVVSTTNRGDASVVRTTETSFWEVRCAQHDSPGDGTVPARSGRDPRESGGRNILQQFELSGVQHEPAYRDYPIAQQVAYYAITKLAAIGNLP